ncbi:MAG: hypothetical protein Q8L48_03985 [Archangium sp.]|nr:hypothetical protein [Archangium sp.]
MPPPLRIGYVPNSPSLTQPGDRRRFVHYARARGLHFELAVPEREYDLVVLSEAADITAWARVPRGKLVFDLIDSYLSIPKTQVRGLLRGTAKFVSRQHRHLRVNHWAALEAMCRRSDAVVCATEEQRGDIRPFCKNVHIVLDIHSAATRTTKSAYVAHRPFRLVWEGLPYTLNSLFTLAPVLAEVTRRQPIELHVVTNPSAPRWLGRFGVRDTTRVVRSVFPSAVFHEWRDIDFAEIVTACDAAIIPLDLSDPFTRGKPENKLLLFWRVGMPVVASASPAYVRAMAGAGGNLCCTTAGDWLSKLGAVIQDEGLRRSAAQGGRAFAEREYSESRLLARWDEVFRSLGFSFGPQATR